MKKYVLALLTLSLSISFAGCGGSKSSDNPAPETITSENKASVISVETLDLTGLWIEEGKAESETHMVATIRDDQRIGVFFILEDDPEPWTYWVGTYLAPTDNVEKYSWTSESTYGGNGMLASSASTKDFSFIEGRISYEVTINGETNTVKLVRGDWDVSKIPDSAFNSVKSDISSVKNIEIIDSAWYLSGDYLYYYIVLHNSNEEIAVELPSFRITARDANGIVLDTEDQTLSVIYPGQDFHYGSQAFSVDEMPTTVDFEVLPIDDYKLKNVSALDAFKPLEVINTAQRKDKFVGEIRNPNDTSLNDVIVLVVGRDVDGKVVCVDITFVDDVGAKSTVPFSISNYSEADISSVEYYANQW